MDEPTRSTRPLRVALATQEFGFHASLEREVAILARELVARGVEVLCYCDPATRSASVEGVVFHDVEPLVRSRSRFGYPLDLTTFAVAATRALRRDRARYDIVHVNENAGWEHDVIRAQCVRKAEQLRWPRRGGRGYRLAHARARLAPALRPYIAASRGIERLQFRPGRFRIVAAVTDEVARDVQAVHGVPPEAIEVVPCAVVLEEIRAASPNGLRRELALDEATPLVLFVGHDFERKGLRDAIAALARVEDTQAHLLVVGGGVREPYVRDAARAGVADRVHFLGTIDSPEHLFASADLFVLPTHEDVWGMAIVEAMAAGLPVVTTATAGAAATVSEADAGIVVREGGSPELADAVRALLEDPSRRRALGGRGRAAAARFSSGAQAEAYLRIYDRILDSR